MRYSKWISIFTLVAAGATTTAIAQGGGTPGAQKKGGGGPAMTLTTTAFADGASIPNKYTQAGDQTSPALAWTNTPAGTQSFVLHMHDMDVARNKSADDQLHWLVWNIPATVTSLPEGVPAGSPRADGSLQVGAAGPSYRGPGAPATAPQHHYTFEIYALDLKLDVQPGADGFATRTAVLNAIQGHILGKAVLVGLFHRPPQ